jgi:hypothetical protein
VLDLICDVDRDKQADTKIRKVFEQRRTGDEIVIRFRSVLRGLPSPAVTQRLERTGDQRVDVFSVPGWQDRLVRFRGSLTRVPTEPGTHVVLPLRRLLDQVGVRHRSVCPRRS